MTGHTAQEARRWAVGRNHLPPPPPGKQGGGPWEVTKVTTTCKLLCSLVGCSAAHTRASFVSARDVAARSWAVLQLLAAMIGV